MRKWVEEECSSVWPVVGDFSVSRSKVVPPLSPGRDVGGVAVEFGLGEDEEAGDEEGGGAGDEDVVKRAPGAGVEEVAGWDGRDSAET